MPDFLNRWSELLRREWPGSRKELLSRKRLPGAIIIMSSMMMITAIIMIMNHDQHIAIIILSSQVQFLKLTVMITMLIIMQLPDAFNEEDHVSHDQD